MYTTYHLSSAEEVTTELLESIRSAYKSKPITITVEEELDATAFLMSNPANMAIIEKSIQQAKNGELIEVVID